MKPCSKLVTLLIDIYTSTIIYHVNTIVKYALLVYDSRYEAGEPDWHRSPFK